MTCHLCVITHDAVIANNTIMSKMAISHDQAIAADHRFFPVNCTTINGYKLTDNCIVANNHLGIFALELQVLWNGSDNSPGKNAAVFTNSCPFHDRNIRAYPGAITDLYILVNNGER